MKKDLIEIINCINKKVIFIFFLTFFTSPTHSFENKILFKIENEIITSFDIYNESKYLSALNVEIEKLDENQVFEISKKSLIRNKIKKIEILKNGIDYDVSKMFTDNLIKQRFSNLGVNNNEEFIEYIKSFDLNVEEVKEKILIEALWNNLIFNKYSTKIKIDKKELKNEIIKNKSKTISYLLYEILFTIKEKNELQNKFKLIEETISSSDFQNAAFKYSVSDSSKLGGKLGWIKESSINKNIKNEISELEVNQYTKPIFTPGGFLILMVKDKKEIENDINIDEELNKLIQIKTNQQFEQYSNIYFNKISRNYNFDEF